jgi:hypothetical protein
VVETLSPEAARLLAEVAGDPRSTLLGRTPPRGAAHDEAPWSASATGLSAAERELLAVWRDEAAYLLRRLVHEDLLRGGAAATAGLVLTGPREPRKELGREEGASRFEGLLEALGEGGPDLGPPAEVGARLRARPLDRLWLVAASLRLAPTATGRAYLADELLLRGEGRGAGRLYGRLLEEPAPAELRSHSQGALALLHGSRGEHAEALRAARLAAALTPEDGTACRGWLLHATQHGGLDEVLAAASQLDGTTPADDRGGSAWLGAVAAQRPTGAALTPKGRRTARRALDRVAAPSRSLLTTLLQLDDTKR